MFSLVHLPYLREVLVLSIHLNQEYINASLVLKILLSVHVLGVILE